MSNTDVAERTEHPVVVFRQQVEARQSEFAAALPAHIPAERFVRVILTAVNKNPALLLADRASLFSSAMMAAADGLLCDGREAALVIYRTKKKDRDGERWIDAVQYMPMVAGILKKVRNSGELSTIVAKVVYGGDHFRNWIDDDGEHLEYEAGEDQDRNIIRNAFSMAKLKDGAVEVEVLKPADIEKIRSVSRSKDKGPWVDWWEEMAKKSAIRRLSKRLPLNTDLDDLIRRDDNLYDFDTAREDAAQRQQTSLAGKLDALAVIPASASPPIGQTIDANTGEVTEHSKSPASTGTEAPSESAEPSTADAGTAGPADTKQQTASGPDKEAGPATNQAASSQPSASPPAETVASGQAASNPNPPKEGNGAATGRDTKKSPTTEKEYVEWARAWIAALDDSAAGRARWTDEKSTRNRSHTGSDAREMLHAELEKRCAEIDDANKD